MAIKVNISNDWFGTGLAKNVENEVNAALVKAEITLVDTSLYFTPDGSTTVYSWKATKV